MYRAGHYGTALLLYAPVGLLLIVLGRPTLAVAGGALAVALAPLPDVDVRIQLVTHRGVTHTVWFALAVSIVIGALGWSAGRGTGAATAAQYATVGFVAGAVSMGSHLLADVVTPAGLKPFWPVSDRRYTLDLVRADNPLANYGLLSLGVLATLCVLALENSSGWL